MALIMNVPDVINVEVLVVWCEAKNLINLDTALCNRKIRPHFLTLISSDLFVVDDLGEWEKYYLYHSWIQKRKVKLAQLFLIEYPKFLPIDIVKTKLRVFYVSLYSRMDNLTFSKKIWSSLLTAVQI